MHRLLARQLKRQKLSADQPPTQEEWHRFLGKIQAAYEDADKDRYLMERSLTISSAEMRDVYEALQHSSATQIAAERDLLQTVIKSMGEGLCALDLSGQLIFMNETARELLNSDETEISCREESAFDLLGLRDEEANQGFSLSNLWSGPKQSAEIYVRDGQLRRPDGSTFPAAYRLNPIRQQEEITGVVFAFGDITARQAVETSLAKRNLLLEQLNEMAVEMSSTLELKPIINIACKTLADLLDVTSVYISDVSQEDHTATVIAEYVTESATKQERISDLGETYHLDEFLSVANQSPDTMPHFFVMHDDDASIEAHEAAHLTNMRAKSTLQVVLRVKGRIVGLLELWESRFKRIFSREELDLVLSLAQQIAMAMDNARLYEEAVRQIEQRRRAQAALSRSEEHHRLLIELTPDPIVVITSQRENSYVNPAFRKLFGWSIDEIIERPELFVPDAEIEKPKMKWHTVGPDESRLSYDTERRARDGAIYDVEINSVRYRLNNGNSIELSIMRDITERNNYLEALSRARDAAESANRTKSVFLANMSHELRTPLSAIIGYSELLREFSERDGLNQYASRLKKIELSGHQLLDIISGVLDLSKIEAGRMDLFLEDFPLDRIVQEALDMTEPMIKKNNNELVLDLQEDIGIIHGDSSKLRQILLNLLSNAAKFTTNGSISLRSRLERRVNTGLGTHWLVIDVSDDGLGISQEQLPLLFEPFVQADLSTTKEYGGTGLGLSISRSFAQMLQGTLTVSSKPGAGSRFTLTLPQPNWSPRPHSESVVLEGEVS